MAKANWIGVRELKAAVARNPQKVKTEAQNFLVRGLREYKQVIIRNPWRLGSRGGGAPTDTKNLRDTHLTQVRGLRGTIGPDTHGRARYAGYVHDGTRRMAPRPWLDYAKQKADPAIQRLYRGTLKSIASDLKS